MQIRSVLVFSAVILGLGSAQGAAWAAPQVAPTPVPSPAENLNTPIDSCPFTKGGVEVRCAAGCHAELNGNICEDIKKLFDACISMKCGHVKAEDPDFVTKLLRCQAWAGGVCARTLGCGFSDESGREVQ
jgi:hypothetical protein